MPRRQSLSIRLARRAELSVSGLTRVRLFFGSFFVFGGVPAQVRVLLFAA